jgi:hypothetical protein
MTLLKKLTEGIVDRDLSKEGQALRSKWEALVYSKVLIANH